MTGSLSSMETWGGREGGRGERRRREGGEGREGGGEEDNIYRLSKKC